ncbi:site-specific integrase [Streptomyces sp. NBC_00335]|uniref:tyrosine-type recombinase/integrase n=1 Tax=unclassified Streptomyces TaxID=2593676 RepID=UPI002252D1A6|nr:MULTISPECIES: tyrosine-type recombinase/integrase [unclassified Streptomyces]MCX5407139.1 site-specific integrase [Streptomyces sp. NBC_00086]
MAGHIQDRWYKTEPDANGKPVRIKTDRYGTGLRYRARYIGPDGTEKSKSFRDREKRLADQWLAQVEADMARGQYVDPRAGRITFKQFAEKWVSKLTSDEVSRTAVESRLRLHAYPHIGSRPLGSFQPAHIRDWLGELAAASLSANYRRAIFENASSVLNAAVDDGILRQNPCRATSVKSPQAVPSRVKPWTTEQLFGVRAGLPARYRAMADLGSGCGLRQGEIFGLPVDEVGFLTGWLHVGFQVKRVHGTLVFAPPKRGKVRDVPLPKTVAHALTEHMRRFPPAKVTLPWLTPDGPPLTKTLLFTSTTGNAVWRSAFNDQTWKPALAAAGIIPEPEKGKRYASAREHGMHALRHFYASVLLDAGESIKALSTYLGHSDPGFTLKVYTHLMPSSEGRTRKAVDSVLKGPGEADDGPQTAQAA